MTTALTVGSDDPALLSRFGRTLASLPVSYAGAEPDTAPQVAVVSGERDWPQRATDAIERGCKALIVVDPGMTAPEAIVALADLAERQGVIVELAERFAGDATLVHHRRELAQHLVAVSTILITQIGAFADQASAALDMLRTLRGLGQSVTLDRLWTTGQTVGIRGTAGAMLIEGLATAGTAAAGQRLQALGFGRTLSMTLHGDGSAGPSDIRIANMKGERKWPGVYQSADRAAWRRVVDALAIHASADATVLRHLADDIAMIGRL